MDNQFTVDADETNKQLDIRMGALIREGIQLVQVIEKLHEEKTQLEAELAALKGNGKPVQD